MKAHVLIVSLAMILAGSVFAAEGGPADAAIYDPDPTHLWNRLNESLFLRTAADGKKYGLDQLDILFWHNTRHLLTDPSHHRALAVLDEFIGKHGDNAIQDPLKRALLQRDLWELFDWSAGSGRHPEDARPRRELQARLAVAIKRLALTTNEIASLPDNYAQAERNPDLVSLPRGLFQKDGAWISVGINGGDPATPAHVRSFGGRSVFITMLRHPDGRKAAVKYLARLRSFSPMWVFETNSDSTQPEPAMNPKLPQFPKNTEWALVRRMLVIDTEGRIQPTRIVESIQLRSYLQVPKITGSRLSDFEKLAQAQRFGEFTMSRRRGAALAAVSKGERGFPFVQFMSKGIDLFEDSRQSEPWKGSSALQSEVLRSCAGCHASFGPGILSVPTFSRMFSAAPSVQTTQIADLDLERETILTMEWKQRQYDWGLFQGLQRMAE